MSIIQVYYLLIIKANNI